MKSAESFSDNYDEARGKFVAEARAAGGQLTAFEHPERGPRNQPLYTDAAFFGAPTAPCIFVMISATHGIEGFCGSGAQIDFMRRGELGRTGTDIAVLMIHAINPFGFAWLRRTTHENIDLNRNWVDFGSRLPVNKGYRSLHSVLCPAVWNEDTRQAGRDALANLERSKGAAAVKTALGGGQYEFPDGLYYGGNMPSWSRQTQECIFHEYLSRAVKVAIIDFHTGLGPWGFGEQIMTVPKSDRAFRRASRWYGNVVKSTVDNSSVGARIGGDGMTAAVKMLPQAEVTAIALEVGTFPREFVIDANRADNWFHQHGHDACGKVIKRNIRNAYFCDSEDWKGMVAGQSLMMCRQALHGLESARV